MIAHRRPPKVAHVLSQGQTRDHTCHWPGCDRQAAPIQAHPHYREGFDDAIDGRPLYPGASAAYEAGWLAATEAQALLEHATPIGTIAAELEAWKALP